VPDLTGLPALDLAIGLAFIFFLLSTLALTIQEFIAAILGLRARTLEQGLRSLLEDPAAGWTYVDKFYDHELIQSLYRTPPPPTVKGARAEAEEKAKAKLRSESRPAGSPTEPAGAMSEEKGPKTNEEAAKKEAAKEVATARGRNAHTQARGWLRRGLAFFKRTRGPSYISPRSFALVVLDNLAPDKNGKTIFDVGNEVIDELPAGLRQRLKPLIVGVETDVETLRTNLEAWFDDTMARVSGWYKRKTQIILLVIGAVLVLAVNANTVTIAERLWSDQTIRAAVVQQADQATSQPEGDDARARLENAADDVASVAKLGVPMGWSGDAKPDWSGTRWVKVLGGWLLTILAMSLGAPFWFDTLGRLSRLRSSGKPETPLPATGSGKPNERVVTSTAQATNQPRK
jgi:hypothetical protein